MEKVHWYSEPEVYQMLKRDAPTLLAHAKQITAWLQRAYDKGHQIGFGEGEHKQAMLELSARDKFLKEVREQSAHTRKPPLHT